MARPLAAHANLIPATNYAAGADANPLDAPLNLSLFSGVGWRRLSGVLRPADSGWQDFRGSMTVDRGTATVGYKLRWATAPTDLTLVWLVVPGAGPDGYRLRLSPGESNSAVLAPCDNDAPIETIDSGTIEISAGDWLAMLANADGITVATSADGTTWADALGAEDATYLGDLGPGIESLAGPGLQIDRLMFGSLIEPDPDPEPEPPAPPTPPAPPAPGPYRIELPGGILLEPVPADAESCFRLDAVDGLDGVDLRESAEAAPDRDGEILGRVLRTGRSITLDVTVVGLDRIDTQTRVAALRRAARPTTGTWPLLIHGRIPGPPTLTIDVRVSQPLAAADGDLWRRRLHACQITLRAPEPRLLDTEWKSTVVLPPGSDGGLEWPLEWPLDWGGTAYGGGTVTTTGDDSTWPLIEIHGPITDPIAAHITTGHVVAITGTVAAGEVLEIDPRQRTVTLIDGGGTRVDLYAAIDRSETEWWLLEPGGQQLGLLGTDTGTTTRMGVLWRDAWL